MLGCHDKLTLCVTSAIPEPVRDSLTVEVLVENESVADAVPLLCGLKSTVYGRLWPAAIVVGRDIPLKENSELLLPAEVTVTLDPAAVRLAVLDTVVPTFTFPNDMLAGVTLSCPEIVPVPLRGIDTLV